MGRLDAIMTDPDDTNGNDRPSFRFIVVAELAPRENYRLAPLVAPTPLPVTRNNFSSVMGSVVSSVMIDIDDPFEPSRPPIRVPLELNELRAFRPDRIAEVAAPVRALIEASDAIEAAIRDGASEADLRGALTRSLPRPEWVDALVPPAPTKAPPETKSEPPRREDKPELSARSTVHRAPTETPASGSDDSLDSLLELVDLHAVASPPSAAPTPEREKARPAASRGNDPVSALISAVARGARSPTIVVNEPTRAFSSPGERASGTAVAARTLAAIVHHPEIRRLERVWRSLRLLVDHANQADGVEVHVLPVVEGAVAASLDALVESDSKNFDVIVLDHVLEPSARDLDYAKHVATVGEALYAPVLLSASPALVGASDLTAIGRTSSSLWSADDPRSVATRNVAHDDAMRFLFAAINGPLVRGPWNAESSYLRSVPFSEPQDEDSSWIAALPAFALAALVARSHGARGWPAIAESQTLEDVVVRQVDGNGPAIGLEALVSDGAARELAKAGIIAFGGAINRDSVHVRGTTSMHRPRAAAAKPAEGTLTDALFLGRLVRALDELTAAIPSGTEPDKIGDIATLIVNEMFAGAHPRPQIHATADAARIELRVLPRGFAGVTLQEVSLDVPLRRT